MDDTKINLEYYEEDRHDRTTRFFGKNSFEKLQNSKILVVGVGAIGNEIVKNFALLGLKEIRIVDFDKVTKSNANRCIFFRIGNFNGSFLSEFKKNDP